MRKLHEPARGQDDAGTAAVAQATAGPEQPKTPRLQYIVGNSLALLVGLCSAYFALTISHTVDSSIIDLRTTDFMEYMSVARLVLHGHGGSMYSWLALSQVQSAIAQQPAKNLGVMACYYPPYFAVALAPLAALPFGLAFFLWLVMDCVLLVTVLYSFEQYTGLTGRAATTFRWVSLCFLPVFMVLVFGQSSVLLLALVSAALFALRAGRQELAGAALAVACLKPAYIAPIILVLLLKRCWRAFASFVVVGLALLLAVVPILGFSIYPRYVTILRQSSQAQGLTIHDRLWIDRVPVAPGNYTPEWNHSVAGFTELLLHGRMAAITWAVVSLVLLLVVAWSSLRFKSIEVPFGLAILVGLLVSPHTLAYDYTLLLIPVVVALRYRWLRRSALMALLICGYLAVTIGYKLAFFVPLQLSVLAALTLAAWLVWVGERQRHVPASSISSAAH